MASTRDDDATTIMDVIVIGGGISGLSAANYVLNHNGELKVRVLEARSRVGGRTWTKLGDDGHPIDVGGAYVGPTQNRVLRIAREFGIETHNVYLAGKSIVALNGAKPVAYSGTIPQLSPLALLDLNKTVSMVELARTTINRMQPWLSRDAAKYDKMTLQHWMESATWTDEARAVMRVCCNATLACEPSEVSAFAFLWYVHAGHGINRVLDAKDGAQERKFVGGSQQISKRLAEKLGMGSVVKLNSIVTKIVWGDADDTKVSLSSISSNDAVIHVHLDDGRIYRTRHIIMAISPIIYQRIRFIPGLPGLKAQLSMRMPVGCIIKTNMSYATPFWRDAGFSGTIMTDSKSGPVQYTYDDCSLQYEHHINAFRAEYGAPPLSFPQDGNGDKTKLYPGIMGFVLANNAREWAAKTREERQRAICEQYATVFGMKQFLTPTAYSELNWNEAEFSGGCYVGIMQPQVLSTLGDTLRQPLINGKTGGTSVLAALCHHTAQFLSPVCVLNTGERAAHDVLITLSTTGHSHVEVKHPGEFVEDEPAPATPPPEQKLTHDPPLAYVNTPRLLSKAEHMLPGPGQLLKLLMAIFVAIIAWYWAR